MHNTTLIKCHGKRAIYINGFILMSHNKSCKTLIKALRMALDVLKANKQTLHYETGFL